MTAVESAVQAVRTRGLTRDYGDGAGIFDVDLEVPRGSVYGLVGPNGAGKTTLLSILAGTRRPSRGEIGLSVPRSGIAVCPDIPAFDPWLTAWEVVDLSARLQGAPSGATRVESILSRIGLLESSHRRNKSFSRGMRQRLGLAAALVAEPETIILDEPVSGLDPQGRADILGLIEDMRGERTVIMSSHMLADVERVCDKVGVLRSGRLAYQGSVNDLKSGYLRPAWHLWVRDEVDKAVDALRGESWVLQVVPAGEGVVYLEAQTTRAGELGVPRVLSAAGVPLAGMSVHAADLESAFLALTESEGR